MNRGNVLRFPLPEVSSISRDPVTHEIVIRLKDASTLTDDLVNVLGSLETLCGTMRRAQEAHERQERADRVVSAFQARCIDVARAYHLLRLAGVKHRAAIRSLFLDPQFSDMRGALSDFGYWVKAYGSFSGSGSGAVSEAGGLQSPQARRSKI